MKHPFKSREPTVIINRDFRARRQFVAQTVSCCSKLAGIGGAITPFSTPFFNH